MKWVLLVSWIWTVVSPALAGELADAAERGELERVVALIRAGAGVGEAQVDGMTALHWATFHDDAEMVEALLAAKADPKVVNRYGVLPMTLACENGNAKIVRLLLDHGADVNSLRSGKETALMTAARTGRVECVDELIARGANIDAKQRSGQTALMWAAAAGAVEVVDALLEAGAEFKQPLNSGFTPLLFAVREGHLEVAKRLIEAGVGINEVVHPQRPGGKRLRSGTAPLILAVENGHFELAVLLLNGGANPNDQRSGYTALHALTWARKAVRGDGDDGIPTPQGSGNVGSLEFVREWARCGGDVNVRLEEGRGGASQLHTKGATAFLMAAQTADLPMLKLLVELGADPSIGNVEGSLPLHAATGLGVTAPGEEAGMIEEALVVTEYLLQLGADINAVDQKGESVMHCAAYKCEPAMMRLLDKRGADIAIWNQKNKHGWTPLMIAQGFRPGNFRPFAEVRQAMEEIMRAHGVEPPPPPERKKKLGYEEP